MEPNAAISYVREGEGSPSAAEQRAAIERLVAHRALDLVEATSDTELPSPIGHFTWSVGGLVTLLDRAVRGRVPTVLVWDLARLRPPGRDEDAVEILETKGVKILETCHGVRGRPARRPEPEPEPTETGCGRARRLAALDGRSIAGPTPYGYRRVGPGLLAVVEDEAQLVREIFRFAAFSARGLAAIVHRFADRRNRTGAPFSKSAIRHMLRNPTYAGRVKYDDVEAPGRHRAIVTPIVFNKARKRLLEGFGRRRRATSLSPGDL